jgi:hypothetical protein
MPDPASATEGVFCEVAPEGSQLGDGAERWSGFAASAAERLPSAAAA